MPFQAASLLAQHFLSVGTSAELDDVVASRVTFGSIHVGAKVLMATHTVPWSIFCVYDALLSTVFLLGICVRVGDNVGIDRNYRNARAVDTMKSSLSLWYHIV